MNMHEQWIVDTRPAVARLNCGSNGGHADDADSNAGVDVDGGAAIACADIVGDGGAGNPRPARLRASCLPELDVVVADSDADELL